MPVASTTAPTTMLQVGGGLHGSPAAAAAAVSGGTTLHPSLPSSLPLVTPVSLPQRSHQSHHRNHSKDQPLPHHTPTLNNNNPTTKHRKKNATSQQHKHPLSFHPYSSTGAATTTSLGGGGTKSSSSSSSSSSYTVGQVVLGVSIGTSVAAMMTVLVAVHAFTNSLHAHIHTMNTTWLAVSPPPPPPLLLSPIPGSTRNLRSDQQHQQQHHSTVVATAATQSVATELEDHTVNPTGSTDGPDEADSRSTTNGAITYPFVAARPDNPNPKLVWLMSFPNSGTSFTIHMTREATNCTTATNYGLEGEIRNVPSVPAIQGPAGVNGPWLELLPHRTTRIADTILVKTHCKGFCSGSFCGADKTFHTTRSFMIGCLTGNQGISSTKGMRLIDKTYDKSLVKRAIHLFRHPLDNVVARFHLEYNEKQMAGDTRYTSTFTKGATGFRRWCALDDRNRGLVQSRYIDPRLRGLMLQIPCFNEFYRFTQWHNLAFETTRAMNVTTLLLHYHEFSDDFAAARGRILNFLELPQVGEGIVFDDGKEYGHYYSRQEKVAIANFLQEFASAETWEQLKDYDFQTEQTQLNSIM